MRSPSGPAALLLPLLVACAGPAPGRPAPAQSARLSPDYAALPPPPPRAQSLNAGTGFFIGRDGTMLTAAHVASGCLRIDVGSDTLAPLPARVVYLDEQRDLAVLRVPDAPVRATLRLAAATSPRETLEAFGYPGEGRLLNATVTRPQLLNAYVQPGKPADLRYILWLGDAEIARGWSGGPVLDDDSGSVVGMTLAFVPDPQQAATVLDRAKDGVALATGVGTIRDVLDRAGVRAEPDGSGVSGARRAVVRVFCWR